MFFYNILFLILLIFLQPIQGYFMNISMAIINTQTVIACGLSIDIYPSFDPNQVIICPHVIIEKNKIQMIYMNISFDDNNQLVIYSNPPLITPPKYLIKLNNNSFVSPINLNRTSSYYLSFSSELICRYSWINNETICYYYPKTSDFIHIEYHYDEIQQGSLMLSNKARYNFYIIFIIITIFIIIICFLAIYILSTNRYSLHQLTQLDVIIDRQVARQEAAKRPTDPQQQDGQPILNEHPTTKDGLPTTGDA